jgi:mannose-6-phosphate isomerase-like protein (cupin superfamily)
MTGGEGSVANVHVVKITKDTPHIHQGYDETYFILSGTGTVTLGQETHPLRPGSVAVIPAGVPHSLETSAGEELEVVIFGTPPMAMDDGWARPKNPWTFGLSSTPPQPLQTSLKDANAEQEGRVASRHPTNTRAMKGSPGSR